MPEGGVACFQTTRGSTKRESEGAPIAVGQVIRSIGGAVPAGGVPAQVQTQMMNRAAIVSRFVQFLEAAVLRQTGKPLVSEIVCNESRCTQDLGRSLDHCQEKFTYEGKCSLDDWDKVWRWVGDPPLTISGTCSAPAATACLVDADCGDGATCLKPSSCDVHRYGPSGWEPCRCIQEVFIKPQIDEWLADVRANFAQHEMRWPSLHFIAKPLLLRQHHFRGSPNGSMIQVDGVRIE